MSTKSSTPVRALRLIARVGSLASLALLAMFATSGGDWPTWREWVAIAFFPVGVALGMIVGWRREALGGILTIASLAAFYAWMFALGSRALGPYFLIFSAPGLLFALCAALDRLGGGPRLTSPAS